MSAPRFFCPIPLQADTTIDLPTDVAHHALRVLRLRDGGPLVLFNGEGGEFPARLIAAGGQARAALQAHDPREAEAPTPLTLVQGLPSGDKMDWIVEKAVELGVTRIVPITAQRSVLQLSGARLEKRLAHWQRILVSACEQCGRNRVPVLDAPQSLAAWLATADGLPLLCDPDATVPLAQALTAPTARQGLALLVGPEGGWSDAEQASARQRGVQAVRFGPRVLRTETAGIALAAAVGAHLGWH